MSPLTRKRFGVITVSAFALAAVGADGQQSSMHETSVEIAQLPTFCWAQMHVPNASGEEFNWHDCGPAANHYCGSLLSIIRARHETNKAYRAVKLGAADMDLRYTERGIAGYPNCSIRDHVASTRLELNNLFAVYGMKRPVAQ
jgi:hypothetical protein